MPETIRKRILTALAAISTLTASPAQADVVAGWDFSQYFGDGALSTDGATFTDTLSANYSNLDPTGNAGAESAAFGMMYMNGEFGSTDVPEQTPSAQLQPVAGSLQSNLLAPVQQTGDNPFDTFSVVASEGQLFTELLSMSAFDSVSVVFEADLSAVNGTGTDWFLTFGGKTTEGSRTVTIDFSTDGNSYSNAGTVTLSSSDTPVTVQLTSEELTSAYIRLNLDAAGTVRPIFDNLALQATVAVPEPGTAFLLALGLSGLYGYSRRRAA